MASALTFNLLARDQASQTVEKLGKQFDKTAESSERLTRGFSVLSAGSKGLHASFGVIAKGAAGIAAAAAATFAGAFNKALDLQDSQAKLTAQLGLSGPAAAQAGKVAGDLFKHAYGDSLDEVNEAVKSVVQNTNVALNSADFKGVTGKVITLSKVFDQDLGGVTRSVGQLMRTGMAKNANDALDIITKGFQSGGDKAGDLLDTLNEYPTQFRKLGVTGPQAIGLISQGLKAGARDSDIVADAIKEFSIRAVDGSTTTAQGFKAIGLNAKTMAEQIGKGGKSANGALDLTLDRLRKIPDPVKRSQAAVKLFGTQAEDLGNALFALDPSKAVSGIGQVAGAADRMNKTVGQTASQTLTSFKRTLTTDVVTGVGTTIQAFQRFGGYLQAKLGPTVQRISAQVGPILSHAFAVTSQWVTTTLVPALQRLGNYITTTVYPAAQRFGAFLAAKLGPTFTALGAFITGHVVPALQGLWVRFEQVLPTLTQVAAFVGRVIAVFGGLAITILGKVLPILIKLSGPIFTALFAAIGKIIGIAAAMARAMVDATKLIINIFLDMVGVVIHGAAKAFGWIPGIGGKLKDAAKSFDNFRDNVNRSLSGVHDKNVTVTAKASVLMGQGLDRQTAIADTLHRAMGGPVRGPGTTTSDSILMAASNDEHVWTAREVAGAGGHSNVARLRKLAAAGQLPGFAKGGAVQFNVLARTAGLPQFRADIGTVMSTATTAATSAAQSAANRAAAQMSSAPGVPTSVSANAALGRALAAQLYGWVGSQWAALYALGNRESGWRNTAQNPTSTAYGIPQFLNSTWATVGLRKTSDPRTQIIGMLRYIAGRYGSPANAWAHETSVGWYGDGMAPTLFRRPTLIGVGERGPETVSVTPHNSVGRATSTAPAVTINIPITVDGVMSWTDKRKLVSELGPHLLAEMRDQLRKVGLPYVLQGNRR